MNFVGHSVVAGWFEDDPRFVLGAMLPDFASMCGDRIAAIHSDVVGRGVEHHHQADAVFHQLPWFLQRMRRLSHQLRVAGLGRGPALGAAHVGIEIALDAVLASAGRESFDAALDAAGPELVDFKKTETGPRFVELIARLRAGSPAAGAREVARRVRGTLSRRPRLALSDRDMPGLEDALAAHLQEISESAGDLLGALRVRLGAD